ncbi:hypothetical protein [Methylobacterium nodulans]|uniref:Uncharacterized protein n=1 Tax=Methylobacterium nodulans (strain LMG 21967 / CNCM I-2342 / ORS 2060) TaxID=460265 RepID=B8IY01_METNO|nr:hypothetical protein [Methylobacterium nodulans]ACL63291.1 conserved hypothetical protein [Methylobacterium nodulans ORS 2060]
MAQFDHILNWTLKVGSHPFPGPNGGTCINEAAIVAAGFPYQPVRCVDDMPDCFSRTICRLAMRLNDEATDAERQRLLPFVARLACADKREVEFLRQQYIEARTYRSPLGFDTTPLSFDEGLAILEGALAIGRQARLLSEDEVSARLVRAKHAPEQKSVDRSMVTKIKKWLGIEAEVA